MEKKIVTLFALLFFAGCTTVEPASFDEPTTSLIEITEETAIVEEADEDVSEIVEEIVELVEEAETDTVDETTILEVEVEPETVVETELEVEEEVSTEPEPVSEPEPEPESEPDPSPAYVCSYDAYNCSDFTTHADAQAVYEYCLAEVGYDVHGFDRDDDGSACESLP